MILKKIASEAAKLTLWVNNQPPRKCAERGAHSRATAFVYECSPLAVAWRSTH